MMRNRALKQLFWGMMVVGSVGVLGQSDAVAIATVSPADGVPAENDEHRSHAGDTLRVLAYNIHHGEGTDGQLDLARVARVIRAQRPDVVLLQEIDSVTARTEQVDQAQQLAGQTGLPHVAFGRFMAYDGGAYGMAILSAHPIMSQENVRLPDGAEPRTSVVARIQPVGWPAMVFANVHLYRTAEERYAQTQRLVEHLADEPAPVIVGGDFNSEPDGAVMRLFESHWTVPTKPVDARRTWPAQNPEVEIDYILYRPADQFRVVAHRVIAETDASDHRPVLLVLTRVDQAGEDTTEPRGD